MDLFEKCKQFIRHIEAQNAGYYPYFRPISSSVGTEVIVNGQKMLMIGSNNYLGLVTDSRVTEAAIEAIKKYGSGCTGSRLLNGTLDLHEQLDHELAQFLGKEKALVFSTGFQTNLGTISCLVQKDDLIFSDRSDHASIVDGCRLSFGKTIKFKHNDMEDLERLLSNNNHECGKLIVVDGVFSMEGDICNLPEIVRLAKKYEARILVDDAHAIGVLGENGRGTTEHFGLTDETDMIMGTFSKSFASLGGVIASDTEVIDYIKHVSRALIFSASIPPPAAASCLMALRIVQQEPERRERLWEITNRIHTEMKGMGFELGTSETPIVPIYIGEDEKTFAFWRELSDEGLFTNPIIPPAISPGQSLIRTSYMATHTDRQIDRVLDTFRRIGKKFGII
ncbi:MAG: aminotransferase class I/II-fold pyridoxal phosphate-dependent enzyme [candidate division Zixibacteria bacterium]|nr:aminotransferase class I/II-fold pyridoxal phosphate-dependent enzyme [candidate division Zixibacteria bacterium]